jgi:PAS domain S-box-containing protein
MLIAETNNQNEELLKGIEIRQASLNRLSNYLSELESQLALIFAASPDIIVFIDGEDGSIIKISEAATRILGYNKNEMIGKQLWDFIDEEDLERTQKLHNQIRKDLVCYFDGENAFVNSWKTKFNSKARLLWRYSVCVKNQIIGVATDITNFGTNAFYNLKMLQSAFDCSKDGIVITDITKESQPIVYVNEAYEKMSGYSHEDLVGKACAGLFNDFEEVQQSRAFQTLNKAKKTGDSCDVLLKTQRKNGTEFFVHIVASAVIEQNVVTNYIGIIRDVTDLIGIEYDWSPYSERGFCPIING